MTPKKLLPKVKANLVLQHNEDDELLLSFIASGIDYAEKHQNQSYKNKKMPSATEQAVIMLSTHFYESRDGGTGGFFVSNTYAATQVWAAVNRLLAIDKNWKV